jgi:hypothetical protein
MADNVEQLKTRRDAIYAELATLDSTKAGGKPNASTTGIDHQTYKMNLYKELREINDLISTLEGPFESLEIAEP